MAGPKRWLPLVVGASLFLVMLIAALAVFISRDPATPDKDIAKLESLVGVISTACLSNVSTEEAARVGASLDSLVRNIKGEGSVSAYRKKRVGAGDAIPSELKQIENAEIRKCMDKYMPAILKTIGIEARGERIPSPFQLRFGYDPPITNQVSPDDRVRVDIQGGKYMLENERLIRQDGGFFGIYTPFPEEKEDLRGSITWGLQKPTKEVGSAPASFCLRRPTVLPASQENHFHLDCKGKGCAVHIPSSKWLDMCPGSGAALVGNAFAEEGGSQWSVPSAATLASAAARKQVKGVGYTRFDIETAAFRDPSVVGVEVAIHVNGVPIYEDALPPELRPVPNRPNEPFKYSFALETLDFQGIQAGCEAISLSFTPRLAGRDKKGTPSKATLAYVSLRDMKEETVRLGDSSLTWSATYVIPSDEWSHQAFIKSEPYLESEGEQGMIGARQRAVKAKKKFDSLGLKFNDRPLVAVIRPPLETSAGGRLGYGLTAGVLQASGQVRFTFSFAEANSIADALIAARTTPEAENVIASKKYVYKAAGNPARRGTPTPKGVCRHVNG
jgi:hypothetical protein